ncbi:MAG: DNA-binding protein [Candidatus Doudnabacteria bacterium]|nr:DNA-binding protein [Candidatus Doudnabacteria bacterium]
MKQIIFRLKTGQLLREEIEKAAIENKIKAGVLLSAVGALSKLVLRMAGAKPDKQNVRTWDGEFEIVSATGTVSENGCHIHLSAADKNGNVFGGHLKKGCVVRVTAEIVIGILEDASFERVLDPETGFEELSIN